VPFVTEALWRELPWPEGAGPRPESLIIARWPAPERTLVDDDAERRMAAFQELVTTVRSLRKEYGIAEGQPVPLLLTAADGLRETLEGQRGALARLARVGELRWDAPAEGTVGAHAVLQGGRVELFLPLADLIDVERERKRLSDESRRLEGQLEGALKRLGNEQFVSKAPAEVVAKERERADALRDQLSKLGEKLGQLGGRA
jgi:valyl-tRNA synthetase